MGCGAGIKAPPETYEIQGTYAQAIFDDRNISINVKKNRSLHRVEVKKYRDAFGKKLNKFKQEVVLIDGLRSEFFHGDCLDIPYRIPDSFENCNDLESGVETHVVVYPAGDGPPERFIVGYANSPKRRCRVRHDNPGRTAILDHSPKKKRVDDPFHVTLKAQVQRQRSMAETEATTEWQTLDHRVMC